MKHLLLSLSLWLLSMTAVAQQVEFEGITYVYNKELGEARVDGAAWRDEVRLIDGSLWIPAFITVEDHNYYVTEIGDMAFSGWDDLECVYLPETLVTIGAGAFRGCRNLVYVNNPSVVMTTIKEYAFEGCTKLLVFILPQFVATIGGHAFENCKSLSWIDFSTTLITEIPHAVCRGCTKLTNVNMFCGGTVPGLTGIRHISSNAFENCGFTSITLPPSLLSMGNDIFQGCDNLVEVVCLFDDAFKASTDNFENYENKTLRIPKGKWNDFKVTPCWSLFPLFQEIDVEEYLTDVKAPQTATDDSDSNIIYNLSGSRVNSTHKGINLVRSKSGRIRKVVMK